MGISCASCYTDDKACLVDERQFSCASCDEKQSCLYGNLDRRSMGMSLPRNISQTYELPAEPIDLGQSRYGIVLKGRCKTSNTFVAVKVRNTTDWCGNFNNEVFHLKKLQGRRFICEFLDTFEFDSMVFIIFKYYDGGDLLGHINQQGSLPEEEASSCSSALLLALEFLHGNKVAHRDIKPENLLLEISKPGELTLADFETANFCTENTRMVENVGTCGYTSPQMLEKSYSKSCDCWSAGVVCYAMLSGRLPFEGFTDSATDKLVRLGKYDLNTSPWHVVSADAKDLVRGLLSFKEEERMTASQALQASWLAKAVAKLNANI